ncbi:hypothetical protein R3P38DRAFT_3233933 [Favolaschia claudopus]|uniref:Uncharacterized protein n=1 Tax=Favolaschia claudopus TaxID=2862362 RepID=A0AAV9ZGP1_9AGAR
MKMDATTRAMGCDAKTAFLVVAELPPVLEPVLEAYAVRRFQGMVLIVAPSAENDDLSSSSSFIYPTPPPKPSCQCELKDTKLVGTTTEFSSGHAREGHPEREGKGRELVNDIPQPSLHYLGGYGALPSVPSRQNSNAEEQPSSPAAAQDPNRAPDREGILEKHQRAATPTDGLVAQAAGLDSGQRHENGGAADESSPRHRIRGNAHV